MSNKVVSCKEDVVQFLHELINILNDPKFDVDNDLDIMLKKKDESPIDPYTTVNTLLELDFNKEDVWQHLLSLNLSCYMETIVDSRDANLPPFYVFTKQIKNRDLYIKVKIRDRHNRKVFCVSFHFARYPITQVLPYI